MSSPQITRMFGLLDFSCAAAGAAIAKVAATRTAATTPEIRDSFMVRYRLPFAEALVRSSPLRLTRKRRDYT